MASQILLYSCEWAHFPRRVLIYLRERGLPDNILTIVPVKFDAEGGPSESAEGFPPKPAGSIPILAIPNPETPGMPEFTYIRQSLAIINYLEDLSEIPGSRFNTYNGRPSMRGRTMLERARVTELLGIIDECAPVFRCWCFAGTEVPTPSGAQLMKEVLWQSLGVLEKFLAERNLDFLDKPVKKDPKFLEYVTIADCALFAMLQYGKGMFGRDMTEGLPKLKDFYGRFEQRKSARLETMYDEAVRAEAMVWAEGTT